MESRPSLNNGVLESFWRTPARNRVLYGGRSSGKSWATAEAAIVLAQCMKLRFLCTRQFQNKIEESVYTLLKIQIERFGWQAKFKITDNKIVCLTTGSEFVFYGLWRAIDEIKSLESIDVHWAEEAHLMTESQWLIIDPTLRKEGSQHWIVFNPRLSTDFIYKRFVTSPPPDTIVRKLNYIENPFLSDTIKKVIEAAKAEDYDEYAHIYLGEPRQDDDAVIIKRSWILASIDAHVKLGFEASGARRIGYDVADSGQDKCANVYAHGSVVSWADEWKAGEDELLKSCSRTYNGARERQASVAYDSIGVGAGSGAKFNEINEQRKTEGETFMVQHAGFNAGGAVCDPDSTYLPGRTNKDMFSNIKAQAWWMLADRFRNTYNAVQRGEKFSDDQLISIASDCPHLDKLIDELSTPRRDYDANGRVKVESKKDLAKRDVASPNLADAFVMCFPPSARAIEIWERLA